MKNELLKDIGKQIALLRMQRNLTQSALATYSKTSPGDLKNYELGKVNISLGTLLSISEALGCRIEIKLRRKRNWKSDLVTEEKTML